MENKHEEIEILDFDSTPSLEETTEMLDFENDVKVAKEIDEMLDFFDFKPATTNEELTELLEKNSDNEQKIEIDATKEKIDEYVPSVKDFNIKSAKTRKIVKKAMLYVIIAMLLGFEFFITKTGEALNDLRVYASEIQPIMIEENEKYGFIDYTGNKIVNPKYSYAGEFIDGYSIVKNSSNLPLIIDKGGKEVAPTGTYFTLYRSGDDIIASKVTKKGLKYGILSSTLNKKVDFKYDMITPVDGAYTFALGNIVGIINDEGKKIFEYKLTDKDDKSIYVTSSNVLDGVNDRYAVVTINSSSMIVNLSDGTVVTNPTLDTISVNDNNVFYKTDKNGNITYFYVYNNSVVMETIDSKEISVDSISAGVIKVTSNNYSKSYVSVKTKEKINKNLNDNSVYYGQNVFMYKRYDYKLYKEVIVMVKNGEEYKVLTDNISIEKPFKNGIAIVKFDDGTYGYLNEEGNFISDSKFIEVTEFDSYGEAIAKTNDGYGVINKDGKVVLDFKYKEIKMVNDEIKKKTRFDENVFYAAKEDTRYAIYNSDGKRVNKTYYNDVIFDEDYPVFKASTDKYDYIITSKELGKITLASFNKEYSVYENYIVVDNNYYNYNGKLIYESNSRE